jgi:periplasmic copper chaperone A
VRRLPGSFAFLIGANPMTVFHKAPSRRHLLTGLAGSLVLIPATSIAHGYRSGDLEIDHPTITPSRGRTGVHAGYMTLINRGRTADRLIAATSPRTRVVELHTHVRDGQMMRMRPVEGGVQVPAGGRVAFQPGGLHLMFFDVTGAVAEGDAVPLRLRFERAGWVDVVAMGENPSAGGHGHSH